MSTVVHVVVAGEVGGAERMLVDLARKAPSPGAARRHVVALMTPSERLRGLFRGGGLEIDDRGPVREDPLSYLARSLGPRDVAWLSEVVRRNGASIVHLHTFGSQVVGTRAAIRAGARIVRTEHSTRVYDDPSCWPFSRWSLRRADVAVCISQHVREVARAKAPWADAKLRVVPNGVDVGRFFPVPLPPFGDVVRFVAVGRLEPRKGFDRAIEALCHVPGAELVIVGDGQDRASLEALARRLGVAKRVQFTGFAADVREHVAAAHAALASSRAEGLGIALLEAMAMGRPVVALPTGGIPELVDDGATGFLARGSDAPALARVMRDAILRKDDLERRGRAASARVAERYSIEAMRSGYERIYAALAP